MENWELTACKKQIEEKLRWADAASWKQRDYLNLIDLIENKTGIALSLSTIKRIWKPEFDGTPHPTTLDVLAQFLDFDNWLAFVGSLNARKENAVSVKKRPKTRFVIAGIILLVGLFTILLLSSNERTLSAGVLYNENTVEFSARFTVDGGVPNTVIFTYDVSQVQADSFFIQQSWNQFRRDKIDKDKHTLTSTYLYPGHHTAKLIANDSIIKEYGIHIKSNGWVTASRNGYMDMNPMYIAQTEEQKEQLTITLDQLNRNNITINKDLMSSYFYVANFDSMNSNHFTLETRLKCDSIFNLTCPHISIIIGGKGEMNYIQLSNKGCEGNSYLKFGDTELGGRNNDLSGLGCDIYQWQDLKIDVNNSKAVFYLNNKPALTVPFDSGTGEITGLNFNFSGTGSIDYVRLSNKEQGVVFKNEF